MGDSMDPQMMQVLTRTNTLLETLTNRLGVPGFAQSQGIGLQPGSVVQPGVTVASQFGALPGALASTAAMLMPSLFPMTRGANFSASQFTASQQLMQAELSTQTGYFGKMFNPTVGGIIGQGLRMAQMVMPDTANQITGFMSMLMPKTPTAESASLEAQFGFNIATAGGRKFSWANAADATRAFGSFVNANTATLAGSRAEIAAAGIMASQAGADYRDVATLNRFTQGVAVAQRELGIPIAELIKTKAGSRLVGDFNGLVNMMATAGSSGFMPQVAGQLASSLAQAYGGSAAGTLGLSVKLLGAARGTDNMADREAMVGAAASAAGAGASSNAMQVMEAAYLTDPALAERMKAALQSGDVSEFRALQRQMDPRARSLIGKTGPSKLRSDSSYIEAAALGGGTIDAARSLGVRRSGQLQSMLMSATDKELDAIATGEAGSLNPFLKFGARGVAFARQQAALIKAGRTQMEAATDGEVEAVRGNVAKGNGVQENIEKLLSKIVDLLTNFTPDKINGVISQVMDLFKNMGGIPVPGMAQ